MDAREYDVAVVDAGAPRNAPAAHLYGFLSRDGMRPAHLLMGGRGEVVGYGNEVIKDRVWAVGRGARFRRAPSRRAGAYDACRAGDHRLRDELPEIPGVRERWGSDVLHRPYCHRYEVRDAPIGVLGGHMRELSVHQALLVRQWSPDVVFFPNRLTLTANERERLSAHGIQIVDGEVARLVVDEGRLSGVELTDGHVVARGVVFVGPRFVPKTSS